ncbi:MAG: IS1182 family transposase [Flavobacteriia bacterium]|jgi:transposase
MKFVKGKNRDQIEFFSLNERVAENNEVRLIDLFVDSLNLGDFGFKNNFIDNGRPAYHPSDLLKLYLYGYLNRIRSSRQLEKECTRNLEVMWLMRGLVPDHNTIANFRKDNPQAIKKVFRSSVQLAMHFELIGGKLLAGDSTKLRAQNSKKNNFNEKKIERHIAYIDAKLEEYASILAREDGDKNNQDKLRDKIEKHQQRKAEYEDMREVLKKTECVQISTSDPDSRQMITRNNITEVAYNVQATVDEKHNIPVDFKVTNQNDSKAMGGMIRRAKTILKSNDFTLLYDKGYHTGTEFDYAHKHGIEVIVAAPDVASHAPDIAFDVEHFNYNKERDEYTCPQGQILTSTGKWYIKKHGKTTNRIKHYKTKECKKCSAFASCTKNKDGRLIERTEHMDLIDANKKRLLENMATYRKRQAIVEHPFGIIKRQWDFYYIMTKKSIKHASADVGFIFTAYNLRRIFNILDQNQLKKHLKALYLYFSILIRNFKPIRATSVLKQQFVFIQI